ASNAGDELTCQWSGCDKSLQTLEELYDHACRHVGYKNDGTFNSTYKWSSCRKKGDRRFSMADHILVHVPLKRFLCNTYGKRFGRKE
ncbi:uncharacterized protein K441DRAFT_581993, partial [Cenococcum geophilum 1.58]|uniref:uncharacterized protein n=1 Tax=Cenococcum geophilum 1.58 TaxID=794803 RepID=UPI00358E22EB